MRRLFPLAACIALAACSFGQDEPTVIDGSSQATFDETLGAARRELGPNDRVKFEAALTEFRAQMFAKADSRAEYQRLIREGMDGLTAPRIVSEFNKNVKKIGSDAADGLFEVKRAITGRSSPASEE
ncbi:MAG: hypothetical protein JWM75_2916 [Sphingomonas bacterium]|nr:hypothetical protein [Sphingomonas bacterium]